MRGPHGKHHLHLFADRGLAQMKDQLHLHLFIERSLNVQQSTSSGNLMQPACTWRRLGRRMSARIEPRSFTRNGRGVTAGDLDEDASTAGGSCVSDIVPELCHLISYVTRLRKKERRDTHWGKGALNFSASGFALFEKGIGEQLFSSGVSLAVIGEQIVRPNILALSCGVLRHVRGGSGRRGNAIPILRRVASPIHSHGYRAPLR